MIYVLHAGRIISAAVPQQARPLSSVTEPGTRDNTPALLQAMSHIRILSEQDVVILYCKPASALLWQPFSGLRKIFSNTANLSLSEKGNGYPVPLLHSVVLYDVVKMPGQHENPLSI